MQLSASQDFALGNVMSLGTSVGIGSDGSQFDLEMPEYDDQVCPGPEFGWASDRCLCNIDQSFDPMLVDTQYAGQRSGSESPSPYSGVSEGQQVFDHCWSQECVPSQEHSDGTSSEGTTECLDDFDFPIFDLFAIPENLPSLSRSSSTSQSSRAVSPASDLSTTQPPPLPGRRSSRIANRDNSISSSSPPQIPPKQQISRNSRPAPTQPSRNRAQREQCTCEYDGCGKTFTRRDDLERHQKGCHGLATERFYCVHCDGCDKSKRGFPRKDKVKSHWKNIHEPYGLEFDFRKQAVGIVEPRIMRFVEVGIGS